MILYFVVYHFSTDRNYTIISIIIITIGTTTNNNNDIFVKSYTIYIIKKI